MSNIVCPGCKRNLDDVVTSLMRQRGKFKAQREAARAERDRYAQALEEIASGALDVPDRGRLGVDGYVAKHARRALNDASPAETGPTRRPDIAKGKPNG